MSLSLSADQPLAEEKIFAASPYSSFLPAFPFVTIKVAWSLSVFTCRYFFKSFSKKISLHELTEAFLKQFGKMMMAKSHTSLQAVNRSAALHGGPYIYMSNHQSLMDIPALIACIPSSLRMVAKESLFKIPIFGHGLTWAGFIPIDRFNRSKAISQLEKAKETIHKGLSIWIAPEGTRSNGGELGPFKKGGFHLALSLKMPIVPVWLEGATNVMKARSLRICPNQKITVYFGAPIPTCHLTPLDLPILMEQVRKEMMALRFANTVVLKL